MSKRLFLYCNDVATTNFPTKNVQRREEIKLKIIRNRTVVHTYQQSKKLKNNAD